MYGCLTFSYCFTSTLLTIFSLFTFYRTAIYSFWFRGIPHYHHTCIIRQNANITIKPTTAFFHCCCFSFFWFKQTFSRKYFSAFSAYFFSFRWFFCVSFFLSASCRRNVLFSCLWEKYCLTTCLFLDELNTSTSCFFFWYLIETGTGDFCVVCYVTETQQ